MFVVRNSLPSVIEPPSNGTARILSLLLPSTSFPVNIVNVYAPTLSSSAEANGEFYEELDATIRNVSGTEHLYLLRDVNAQMGADDDL